ncbi:MAG: SO_0444 family Cu/Zn efflux transporter [Bacteroidales bacterium]|nr:SO_0444 family Cu/Zn efflux transporter [Bacteroidales bacterium]
MKQFFHLINEMSPYLLLGFLLAGLMHAFIPGKFYAKYLSNSNFKSVLNAALLGIPLPLCSCGVIPTAMSLRKEGASKGAAVSFLIATPQTGVDSILATYGLMGLPFAIVRPIAALFTAIFGGWAVKDDAKPIDAAEECHGGDCCCDNTDASAHTTFAQKLAGALRYGYVTMMQDIGKWLVVGLVVAALITLCIPTEWFAAFQANTWASMLLVLAIAIPMYVCATGSIPIAVALMMKGLTPGAALVLLMAGPACNAASILVVRKALGTRTLAVYLLSIIVGAVAFGSLIDYLHFSGLVDFLGNLSMNAEAAHQSSWLSWACTALLLALLANALLLQRHNHAHSKTQNKTPNMTTFKIEGMNCNHCRMAAEKAILAVEGVTAATVDLQKKEAQVEGTASAEAICKAVEEVGFTCTAQ